MRWQAARSRRSWRNTEFQYVQPPCEEWERSLVGLYRRRHIVSSSEPQTRRNDWSTLGVCWKVAIPFTMWSSLTNAPFPFSNTAVPATGRSTSRWSASQNRSIQLKFMFGVGLADMVPQRFASLMASWMLFSSVISSKPLWYRSLERSCPIIVLCKIMTQSIPLNEQRPSLKRTASTGGKRPRKVLTLTRSRICGTSWSSFWRPKWSHATNKSWWTALRNSGQRKSRQRSVQNILITFCTRPSQLWWRLKALPPSFKNGSFQSHRTLLRLMCSFARQEAKLDRLFAMMNNVQQSLPQTPQCPPQASVQSTNFSTPFSASSSLEYPPPAVMPRSWEVEIFDPPPPSTSFQEIERLWDNTNATGKLIS